MKAHKKLVTQKQILDTIEKKGKFTITYRYRDEYLVTMCRNLKLKLKTRYGGCYIFVK